MKLRLMVSTAAIVVLTRAFGGRTVYEETFDKTTSMEAAGWVRRVDNPGDAWTVSRGSLAVRCAFNPYKGSEYTRNVPFVRRGAFFFDVDLNSTGARGYDHLSLKLRLYNVLTSFKQYGGSLWMRYYDRKWRVLSKSVPIGNWVTCKIAFDVDRQVVEYYVDDMSSPCVSEEGVTLTPLPDGRHGEIAIGNYGLAKGTLVHRLDNFRLVEEDAAEYVSPRAAGGATIFAGIASSRYRISELLEHLGVKSSNRFTVINAGSATLPVNKFALDRMPSAFSTVRPRIVILADMPLGPGAFVPNALLRRLCEDVEKGTDMLVLGGLFTLNKGEFQTSPLRKLLPVVLGSPWAVTSFDEPRLIEGRGVRGGAPAVKYLHALVVIPGANVLATAGGAPFLVSRQYGKGTVVVCLGMPCGRFDTPTPFWKWEGFVTLLANALNKP